MKIKMLIKGVPKQILMLLDNMFQNELIQRTTKGWKYAENDYHYNHNRFKLNPVLKRIFI